MNPAACPYCAAAGAGREFSTREMMFGTREPHVYRECPACRSLAIRTIPADLAACYPAAYYAFELPEFLTQPAGLLRRTVCQLATTLPGLTPLTRRLAWRYPFFHWARLAGIRADSAVLDVGCGAGILLHRMRRCGYTQLTGIDPYLPSETQRPGLTLRRAELADITETFDLVMLHHVLEHLPDPAAALRAARARLKPGGRLLVRLPLADSPLAREYGPDWFNLDPPRHLSIPSRAGFHRLAAATGLTVLHEETDATPLSILHSEGYRRDVPMRDAPQPGTAAERQAALTRIRRLNAAGEGDCGLFLLTAAEPAAPTAPLPAGRAGV